ncbi:hypothetical protein AGLY_010348 [Aphis glycines]|uniref:Uncharacterized protein n=1 Tax=Aphis glycines TaxID=307491 RepID=A0A6G0TFQ5_APHGL|nr:hypothetical protein AGLY_010348 [Aphis glycines]
MRFQVLRHRRSVLHVLFHAHVQRLQPAIDHVTVERRRIIFDEMKISIFACIVGYFYVDIKCFLIRTLRVGTWKEKRFKKFGQSIIPTKSLYENYFYSNSLDYEIIHLRWKASEVTVEIMTNLARLDWTNSETPPPLEQLLFLKTQEKRQKKSDEKQEFLRKTSFQQNRFFYVVITQKQIITTDILDSSKYINNIYITSLTVLKNIQTNNFIQNELIIIIIQRKGPRINFTLENCLDFFIYNSYVERRCAKSTLTYRRPTP